MNTKIFNWIIGLLCVISVWQLASAGYIHAKAELAQHLVEQAWQKTKQGDKKVKPWPWADTYPVARLRVPKLGVDQMVLSGASGRTMAFGPGWMKASVLPGENGVSVLSGHRDTHFEFLKDLQVGDLIEIESLDNHSMYKVTHMGVVDSRDHQLTLDAQNPMLVLVTCYPFGGISTGGPLRYVISTEKIQNFVHF